MIISAVFTFQINERENWSASMLRPLVVTPHQVENSEEPEDDHEEDDGDRRHLLGDHYDHLQSPLQPLIVSTIINWRKTDIWHSLHVYQISHLNFLLCYCFCLTLLILKSFRLFLWTSPQLKKMNFENVFFSLFSLHSKLPPSLELTIVCIEELCSYTASVAEEKKDDVSKNLMWEYLWRAISRKGTIIVAISQMSIILG